MGEVITEKSWIIPSAGIGRRDYSQNVERYDAEPTLLLLEGFEHLPPSWRTAGSAGYSVERLTTRAWRGGACLRMRTGNDPVYNYAGYYQYFGLVSSMKIMADVRFAIPVGAPPEAEFDLVLSRFTGPPENQRIDFHVVYIIASQAWFYVLPTGLYAAIPSGAQSLQEDVFHHLQMAGDFNVEEHLFMQCNEKRLSLKGIPPYKIASPLLPAAYVYMFGVSDAVPNVDYLIDNVKVSEVV